MNSLSPTDRLKDLLPQLFSEQQRQGNYYLRFQLTQDINVLLDLSYVQESITIDSSQITPIPNLPEYVMGLMSTRNQVFLALDLAHLAGFPPETINQRAYQTIVVRVPARQNNLQIDEFDLYGLTVKQIQGVSRILPAQFNTSTVIAPDILRPFIKGSIQENQDDSNKLQYSFLIDLERLITTQIKS